MQPDNMPHIHSETADRMPDSMTQRHRWTRMEQFEAIAAYGPTFSGDLIGTDDARALRAGGLVEQLPGTGDYVLTDAGRVVWLLWRRVPGYISPAK